eukprot:m.654456 g.654456  ORF g.654456 m.654456 type:complete len:111 (+) comp58411_c1_seq5:47-379(+)
MYLPVRKLDLKGTSTMSTESIVDSAPSTEPSSNSSNSSKPASQWTCDEVATWLESVGLGNYKDTFLSNDIKGENLLELGKDDLKELGVTALGHRMTLVKGIDLLRQAGGS